VTGVFRFDCYPSDFLNGIFGLTSDEIAAYFVVIMLIYDRGEPVPYGERNRELRLRTGLVPRKLHKAISHLIELGKLSLVDGALTNRRAAAELEKIHERTAKNRESSARGGEANRQRFAAPTPKCSENVQKMFKKSEVNVQNEMANANEINDSIKPNGSLLPLPLPKKERETAETSSARSLNGSKKPRRKGVKTQIAEDSQPTDQDRRFSEEAGLSGERYRREWQKFRDHHVARKTKFADWEAAWRNWVRRRDDFNSGGVKPDRAESW